MNSAGGVYPAVLISQLIDECGSLRRQLVDDRKNFASLTLQNIHERNQEKMTAVAKLESLALKLHDTIKSGAVDSSLIKKLRDEVTNCESEIAVNARYIGKYIDETRKIFSKFSRSSEAIPMYGRDGCTVR